MAIQWTTAIRDRACMLALGFAYASCSTAEKAFIDNTDALASPNSSPAGIAGERLTVVQQYSQWFNEAGATSAPDSWEHVYVREVAAYIALAFRRGDVKLHFDALAEAWDSAMDSFTLTDANSSTLTFTAYTPKAIRYHVIRHCLRRGTGKRRLYIPVTDIDRAIQWSINFLWNRTAWSFRKRLVQITVTTSSNGSAPTIGLPSGETFHSVNSRWLAFDNSSTNVGNPTDKCVWLDETAFMERKADLGSTTGKPLYFNVENRSGTLYWHWLPIPDATYTLRGSVLIAAPSYGTDATDTTVAAAMPAEARHLLPELALAKCLQTYHVEGYQAVWDEVMSEVEQVLPTQTDEGDPAREGLEPMDVYRTWNMGGMYGGQGL